MNEPQSRTWAPGGDTLGAERHAVAEALWGRRGQPSIVGGLQQKDRLPLLRDPLLDAIGVTFALSGAEVLTAIVRGQSVSKGTCLFRNRPVRFDLWFPHVSIAVDRVVPKGGEEEMGAKAAWCAAHGIVYVQPAHLAPEHREDTLRDLRAFAIEQRSAA